MAGRRNNREFQDDINEENSQEEAIEENSIIEEEEIPVSSEGEGDDLMEQIEDDYKPMPELDRYEVDGLDDEEEYDDMDISVRQKAEREIDERNYLKYANQKRIPEALKEFDLGEEDEEDINLKFQRRRQMYDDENSNSGSQEDENQQEEDKDEREFDKYLDREQAKGKLHLWIKEETTVRFIRKTFRKFLLNFRLNDSKNFIYIDKINEMCQKNKSSLEINYTHLYDKLPTIALWIIQEPMIIFPYLNDVAFEVVRRFYPTYSDIHPEVHIRITEYPVEDHIRNLRYKDLGQLIQVKAVITQRSPTFSQLKKVYYICQCGDRKGPLYLSSVEKHNLGTCPICQRSGPFYLDKEFTVYRNFQKLTIQEPPGSVPPGRVPRQKEVIVLGDDIDAARPGDEILLTGIYLYRYDYMLNVKNGFPVFSTMIEANFIKRVKEIDTNNLSAQRIAQIRELSKKHNVVKLITNSIAPSIHEHQNVKMALALAMFGGVSKDIQNKHKIRGDINVLLLGDPGVAKSQFLKSVEKTFYRCVFTTGKGASAVGLTASVKRDHTTGEWTLQGGALVLADKGICLIDEFDKMNDHDRTSIHEAMEQQSISISKVGIVASLQAKCSVIAAANPIKGRYDSQLSFMDNVNLTDPILSRFDILCVVKDEVDKDLDYKLAGFVINSHIKNHPVVQKEKAQEPEKYKEFLNQVLLDESRREEKEQIPSDILKDYIFYARQNIHPKIQDIKKDKIKKFYTDLRQESAVSGGMIIAVRHIESIIRMSEAHAKMHLREIVIDEDVDVAINVMLESFIQSQKYSVARMIRSKFSSYLTKMSDNDYVLYKLLNKIQKEHLAVIQFTKRNENQRQQDIMCKIPIIQFEHEAKEYGINKFEEFYNSKLFQKYFERQQKFILAKQ
ncbi:mcm2-3-5 family protein, putative [Ichthyophthirius multifiliis]|uniref:DNA replication licensing factor MCM2 n=1 Tax=Ichthyophthirius multifiliis TaxID=5932 RepID=G0QT83_ICHMU|nr:mcm2-3-5 family protein, putative [Ichthyophthirius multifiliis]EGR31577.1 mcm2-3-5 family protein, putative [Ichthyophthirius multifiliis]|eukprot:XP_004035063.1 mcm2-3-5 family protein, putative [Ichthyophthirius multifiliis]